MASLRTDSPLCRRIALAFLDFLNSVEPASGIDLEGLEVTRECLAEAFKLNPSSIDGWTQPGLLVNLFSSLEADENHEIKSEISQASVPVDATRKSSVQNAVYASSSEAKELSEDNSGQQHTYGVSKDELFGQFFGALEKIHFFKPTANGDDDQIQLDKATRLFHDAVTGLERSGCQAINKNNLAEALKSQGNKAMQSKLYSDAIELYNCAIALCENNAIYFCNRAAAYTQIHKYTEAIKDCLKSIEIEPNYSKAYSRMGLAYYAQGNYSDAINKGFMKALELDPNNESVKENIRAAEQKLKEELQQTEGEQNAGSTSHTNQEPNSQSTGSSWNHAAPPPFASMPFNAAGLPADLASMLMNLAATAYQGQHAQGNPQDGGTADGVEPDVRINGNLSMNFEIPEDLTGTWRSVMEMLSRGAPNGGPPGDANRGPAPN